MVAVILHWMGSAGFAVLSRGEEGSIIYWCCSPVLLSKDKNRNIKALYVQVFWERATLC